MNGPQGPKKFDSSSSRSSGLRRPELRYLAVGRVVRAHGLRGEVAVEVLTEFPERFEYTEWFYFGDQFEATPYQLEKYRWHKKRVLLTLSGITDRTQAEQLKGQYVQVPLEEATDLPEGAYYLFQLIGLQVFTTTNEFLGELVHILETGANDVYIIKNEDQELLLPAIPEVIKAINLEKEQMIVELMEGLI